ncbi:MAG: hypothetical protein Q4F02_00710 [Candidatus Saccharibacteria bacterium]|nr:hypothetical protein [Candidatus Saccharibacteria bacterium]
MGFFDDPRLIHEAKSRQERRVQDEQQTIHRFCSKDNLNRIVEHVKTQLQKQFIASEGVRYDLYSVDLGEEFGINYNTKSLILESQHCLGALQRVLCRFDNTLRRVSLCDEYESTRLRLDLEF